MSSLRDDIRKHEGSYPQYTSIREMLADIVQRVKKSQPDESYFRNGVAVDADTYFHNLLGLNGRPDRDSKPVEYIAPKPLARGESRAVPVIVSEDALRALRSEYKGKSGRSYVRGDTVDFGFTAIDPFAQLDETAVRH